MTNFLAFSKRTLTSKKHALQKNKTAVDRAGANQEFAKLLNKHGQLIGSKKLVRLGWRGYLSDQWSSIL
jgi:hypothetical protein